MAFGIKTGSKMKCIMSVRGVYSIFCNWLYVNGKYVRVGVNL
jgi:hypothetical protein